MSSPDRRLVRSIKVQDQLRKYTVPSDECRLPSGELVFAPAVEPPRPAFPQWLSAPPGSAVRGSTGTQSGGFRGGDFPFFLEFRSMQCSTDRVVAFYEGCVSLGGLVKDAEKPGGRPVPGFEAENDEFGFSVSVYSHQSMAFWTIWLAPKVVTPGWWETHLWLEKTSDGVAFLYDPQTQQEYLAPASALTEIPALNEIPRGPSGTPIRWSSLPEWVQFGVEPDTKGTMDAYLDEQGAETWSASLHSHLPDQQDHRSLFETCLDSLDRHGFDPTGELRPDRSYCLIALIHLCIKMFGRCPDMQLNWSARPKTGKV